MIRRLWTIAAALTIGTIGLHVTNADADGSCTPWDARDTCCPSACAAKNGREWPRADEILRACMRSIGCSEDQAHGASVHQTCECAR